jgi:hypothetical protein
VLPAQQERGRKTKHRSVSKKSESYFERKMKFPRPNPAKPLDGSPDKWYNTVSVFSSEVLI